MKISFYDTFIVQNFKNSHFCPNNYKGIIQNIRDKNTPFSAFTILLFGKSMEIAYFRPYFYKGIVLKNRGQSSLESAFTIDMS